MANPIPNALALTSIADDAAIVASDHRNNYSAIQAAVNAFVTALKGGTAGALLYATDASDVAYLPEAPTDGQTLIWNAAAGRWKPGSASGAGTELDYAQITVPPAAVSATTEGTAVAQITGSSVIYDGTRVKVEFAIPEMAWSATGQLATFVLLRDATVIGHWVSGAPVNLVDRGVVGATFDTPAAGAHTYKLSMYVGGNNATVQAGAGGSGNLVPAFLRVTKA